MIARVFNRFGVCLFATAVVSLVGAGSAAAGSISLVWDPNPDLVNGYVVYVGVQSGTYTQRYDVGGATYFNYTGANAGQQYCFAVSAYASASLEGPKSAEVCGFSNAPPTLLNPGNQSSTVGQPVSLQLIGSDPASQPLSYTATGLPAGLSVMVGTGLISGTGSTAGTYTVTAQAFDGTLAATQSFTWTMAAAAVSDTTPPTVTISGPTTASSYSTTSSTVSLAGTGSDNKGVSSVSWANDRGGSGLATGTTSWNTPLIVLQDGTNVISVLARDAAGNQGTDVLTVTYSAPTSTPPPSSIVLSGTTTTTKFKKMVRLSWTVGPWIVVDLYRNGTWIAQTNNDGSYNDTLKTPGTYNYKVCSPSSTTNCSNTLIVYY